MENVGVEGQTATDFKLGKTATRMPGYFRQAVVKLLDTRCRSGVHLVDNPKNAVALDTLMFREEAKCTITAQENPGSGSRKREGEAIREGKSPHPLPVGEGAGYCVTIQFFHGKSQPHQFGATPVFQLALVKQVGNSEPDRKAETGLQQGPLFEINENRGVGDQHMHWTHSAPCQSL